MVVVSVLLSVRNFNPRTPCGVRQAPAARTLEQCHFNPRTPCGVRLNRFHCSKHPTNFNPRTPCGVRLMFDFIYLLEEQFQSTHPLRGATHATIYVTRYPCISIHAPLAGCDWGDNLYESLMDGFQSTHPLRGATPPSIFAPHLPQFQSTHPLRGATLFLFRRLREYPISIHAPLAGCDAGCVHMPMLNPNFNPRTPCGVRPRGSGPTQKLPNFNPRTPCGVRPRGSGPTQKLPNFNPRTPCGVRPLWPARRVSTHTISIHAPLAGCDFCAA